MAKRSGGDGGGPCGGGDDAWCGGRDGARRTAGDGGNYFGAILEWFWEHKIHGQNIEKNV